MSDCPHEIWERESDVTADGSCPICLRAEIEQLKAEGDVSDKLLADAKAKIKRLQSIIRKQMSPTEISQRLAECNELSDAYAEQVVTIKELRAEIEQLRAEIELVSK